MTYGGGGVAAGLVGIVPWVFGREALATVPEPMDPLTIPKYAQQLTIPRTLAPSVIRDGRGRVIRHDYAISANAIRAQVLPPGLPQTTVWAYGDDGEISVPDPETVGQVMRFTVVDSAPVPPPALDPRLFPPRATLVPNAPTRTKVTVRFRDDPEHGRSRCPRGGPTRTVIVGRDEGPDW